MAVAKKKATKKVAKKKATKKVAKKKVAKKVTKKKVTKKVAKKTVVKKAIEKKVVKNSVKKEVKKISEKTDSKPVTKTAEKKEIKLSVKKETKKPKVNKVAKEEIIASEIKVNDQIQNLSEDFSWDEIADSIASLDFFVDQKSDECAEEGCDNIRTTQGYCRLHYIANFQEIKKKREILKEGRLQEFIEELISKYPAQYIEALVSDLDDEKDFIKALHSLNIATGFESEDVDFDSAANDDEDDDIESETRSYTPQSRFNED